jgi:site-specific DNA recombinase
MNHTHGHASQGDYSLRYAAIYARVSTEDQGKGFSIPTQIEAGQKLAEREGYTVPEAHVLIDEGLSGTTMDRPGLRILRDLVNARAIMAAIVFDPDRLSRNLGHQLLLAEEFERASVKLLIVSHPLEPGPEGWMFFQMRGALAEYERAKLLERSKRGARGRAQAGHPGGGNVQLGYRYVSEPHGGRWEIDPEEAPLVQRIFALCLAGETTRGIARILTTERVPTASDRHPERGRRKSLPYGVWEHSTVRTILTYHGYTGVTSWGKRANIPGSTARRIRPVEEWITLAVPQIIDADLFAAAQDALRERKRLAPRNQKHNYLLGFGRLRCARCGRAMSGFARGPGRRYYRCGSRRNIPDPTLRCPGSVRAEGVEAEVWAAVVHILEQPELIAAEVSRRRAQADEQKVEIRQQMGLIEASLTKCDREAQRWADAYAGEVINLAELKGYRAEIAARRQSLEGERDACQRQLEAIGAAVQQVDTLTAYCARVRQQLQTFDQAEKRLAIEALDIRVSWIPGQPLTIQGSIPIGQIADIPPSRPLPPQRCDHPRGNLSLWGRQPPLRR